MSRLWTGANDNPLSVQKVLVAASPPWQEVVRTSLQDSGSTPYLAKTIEDAVYFLEFQQPGFFILTENFSQGKDLPDPLLGYVQKMSAFLRRELFVVYLYQTAKSGDVLSAFSQSVNLVLHPDDLNVLVALITESWTAWKELYQIFIQTQLQVAGRS